MVNLCNSLKDLKIGEPESSEEFVRAQYRDALKLAQYESMLQRMKPMKNYCRVKALGMGSK